MITHTAEIVGITSDTLEAGGDKASHGLRARRGFVMPIVIFAVVVMAIFASSAFRTAGDTRRTAWSTRGGGLALYAAEGGMRKTLGSWPASVTALNPGDSLNLGWQSLPNRATYQAVIHRMDGGGLQMYRVIVQGRAAGGVSGQSTITQTVSGVPIYKWGVFTQNGITVSGAGVDDSYDSDDAPYSALTAGSEGDIGSNGTITLSSGSITRGNVTSSGAIISNGIVTGQVTDSAPPFPLMPIRPCPGPYTPASALPPGADYDPVSGVLRVSSPLTLQPPPPGQPYFFRSIIMSGGGTTLTVNTGGQHVDIVIENQLSVSGGGIINNGAQPTDLEFSACGTAFTTDWKLTGGSGAYYTVYAPNHHVAFSGGSDLHGAIVSRSFTGTGGSKIHYDLATARNAARTFVILGGTWAQHLR